MKLRYETRNMRARKDERPNLNREGKIWAARALFLEGQEKYALISGHWLYFEHEGQWFKLNLEKYEVPLDLPAYHLTLRQEAPLTEEERRARKKARRQARRAAARAGQEEEEDEEDEQDE